MSNAVITNQQRVRFQDTELELSRSILDCSTAEESKYGVIIQYLNLDFCQRTDTSFVTKITINSVTKAEMLEFAKKIQLLAESFQ
jgi:hypothetical protein